MLQLTSPLTSCIQNALIFTAELDMWKKKMKNMGLNKDCMLLECQDFLKSFTIRKAERIIQESLGIGPAGKMDSELPLPWPLWPYNQESRLRHISKSSPIGKYFISLMWSFLASCCGTEERRYNGGVETPSRLRRATEEPTSFQRPRSILPSTKLNVRFWASDEKDVTQNFAPF